MTNPFNPRPLKEAEFLNQELGDSFSFMRHFRIFRWATGLQSRKGTAALQRRLPRGTGPSGADDRCTKGCEKSGDFLIPLGSERFFSTLGA